MLEQPQGPIQRHPHPCSNPTTNSQLFDHTFHEKLSMGIENPKHSTFTKEHNKILCNLVKLIQDYIACRKYINQTIQS